MNYPLIISICLALQIAMFSFTHQTESTLKRFFFVISFSAINAIHYLFFSDLPGVGMLWFMSIYLLIISDLKKR